MDLTILKIGQKPTLECDKWVDAVNVYCGDCPRKARCIATHYRKKPIRASKAITEEPATLLDVQRLARAHGLLSWLKIFKKELDKKRAQICDLHEKIDKLTRMYEMYLADPREHKKKNWEDWVDYADERWTDPLSRNDGVVDRDQEE